MCTTQASSVNIVIGVLAVLCELHVIVRVHVIPLCDDAVIGLTLSLIAHVVVVVFVVAQAIELQAYPRVIALSRTGQDRERILVLPPLFALLHWPLLPLWGSWTIEECPISWA